jgi:hypothetical protein
MSALNLKTRVEILESELARLKGELQTSQRGRAKDWRRTIGAFTDDEGMKDLLKDAMRLREADRKKARSKSSSKRRTKE